MKRYFKKCRWFQEYCKGIRKVLANSKASRVQTCSACTHRLDKHDMNCIECCPINRAMGA